jgi:hypothetical protein
LAFARIHGRHALRIRDPTEAEDIGGKSQRNDRADSDGELEYAFCLKRRGARIKLREVLRRPSSARAPANGESAQSNAPMQRTLIDSFLRMLSSRLFSIAPPEPLRIAIDATTNLLSQPRIVTSSDGT